MATLAGCGGGGGGAAVVPVVVPPTTTNVTTSVIDGALRNALVCVDKNLNGACDASETQGRTDAAGSVTLAVPNADVGQYPMVAEVGTDAVDADNGPVTVPFKLSAPAGQAAVVSPLTTQVVNVMATGATLAQAEASVKASTNINVGLFQDFTTAAAKAAAVAAGGFSPSDVARMIVVTTQAQSTALAAALGTAATGGATITPADLDKAVQQKILQLLPDLVAAVTANPGLTGAALEAAVVAAVTPSLATPAQAATLVAINNQQVLEAALPVATYVPTSSNNLDALNFTDGSNWSARVLGTSLAGATPDANGLLRVFDRRSRSNAGVIANWNFGTNPQDQGILHWTGSAWEPCGLNFEFPVTLRNANGNNSSNYCNNYSTTASNRVSFDISGRAMNSVYDEIRTAGMTNLTIANAPTVLGTQTFPTDSKLFYVTNTRLTSAFAYNPGSNSVAVKNKSAAGGDGTTGTSPTCNGAAPNSNVASLEDLVATFKGETCLFGPTSITSANGTFQSPNPIRAQGASTLSLGITLGNVVLSSPATAFYTGNKIIRVAFAGVAGNAVTYYACDQQFGQGFTHNCVSIGTGTHTISSLPDGARVLTFANLPAQTATLGNNRVFIERSGAVYYGFKDKISVTSLARLNHPAGNALMAKLGLPAVDPEVPMALTTASYQGTWDLRDATLAFSQTVGVRATVSQQGTISCIDNVTNAAVECTSAITNPASGAFGGTSPNGNSRSGTLDFIAGTATGVFNSPASNPPVSGNLLGRRR